MPTVATPTFSPVAGTYNGFKAVTISTVTSGSTIYYTTDGSIPTISSSLYTGPITVDLSMTVKALAVHIGDIDSAIGSAIYVLNMVCQFVDASSNAIANGTIIVCLSSDSKSSGGQVISKNFKVTLNANGVADLSSILLLSGLTNNYGSVNAPSYSMMVYTALGELVWEGILDLNSISIDPTTSHINTNASQQFVAIVFSLTSLAVTWSVIGGSANGTVDSSGLYTAPNTPGTYTVRVTMDADPTKYAEAVVTVTGGY